MGNGGEGLGSNRRRPIRGTLTPWCPCTGGGRGLPRRGTDGRGCALGRSSQRPWPGTYPLPSLSAPSLHTHANSHPEFTPTQGMPTPGPSRFDSSLPVTPSSCFAFPPARTRALQRPSSQNQPTTSCRLPLSCLLGTGGDAIHRLTACRMHSWTAGHPGPPLHRRLGKYSVLGTLTTGALPSSLHANNPSCLDRGPACHTVAATSLL